MHWFHDIVHVSRKVCFWSTLKLRKHIIETNDVDSVGGKVILV